MRSALTLWFRSFIYSVYADIFYLVVVYLKNENDELMRFTFTTSLLNRGLLSLALITNIFAVSSVHADLLMTKVKAIENQLDARIGVSIYDATHNQHWH